jgi:hypothetical protein
MIGIENEEMMRERVFDSLENYGHLSKIIVVSHGMLINSVFPGYWAECGEVREY